MKKKTVCIRQLVRPSVYVPLHDIGDCVTCKPHADNKKCKNYHPVTVCYVDVKKEKE